MMILIGWTIAALCAIEWCLRDQEAFRRRRSLEKVAAPRPVCRICGSASDDVDMLYSRGDWLGAHCPRCAVSAVEVHALYKAPA